MKQLLVELVIACAILGGCIALSLGPVVLLEAVVCLAVAGLSWVAWILRPRG